MPQPEHNPALALAHTIAACIAAALATGPTSIAELAIIGPALVFFATIHLTHRVWIRAFLDPLGIALLLFATWSAIGIVYAPDTSSAIDEFGSMRFFPIMLLVMPSLHLSREGRLRVIGGVAVGIAIGQVVQLLHAWAALGGGPAVFDFGRAANRISGYWDPAVAGTILTAGLGLHLPPALMGKGRSRVIAIIAASATLLALLATGSRGGWIASAGLIGITSCVALLRSLPSGTHRKQTVIAVVSLGLITIAGAITFRATITARIDKVRSDLDAIVERGDYSTADAARIAMASAALDAFRSQPVRGVGTGHYGDWAREHAQVMKRYHERLDETPDRAAPTTAPPAIHDHAHNTALHVMASNGAVGFVLLLAVTCTAIRGAALWIRRAATESSPKTLGSYHAGPLFALLGLVLITPFDTLHVSASSAAVTGVVLALCAHPPKNTQALPASPKTEAA